ncbi:hypothetical protein JM49_19720 [Pseudomonas chlororaphis subsp. aurantiaca]|uniref:DUF4062 domain-containing protein n=1 Tax=Pseudomonas chlororaphis TaxID=587753 RepID=UPI00050D1BBB|nr:DUF4062 domain-containing protein [Pseudomonas chlororaphis]AIS13802.1 hypothetical protein JM49_19720 [Pseudomonas chlororaphis subsp. aurantiaca]
MEKRYQVFVSSTFIDLQEARKEVMQALLELDCIPSGMELFPAADEDQWSLIKKVIDDSDYYIVILAGRYGSIGPEGYSYTEMEYRYATEVGKPVIGFVYKDPGQLPANVCEETPEGKAKLNNFRILAQQKMCRFWESPSDLGSQVSRSLVQLIKSKPAIGWVRANLVPNESAAKEILKLHHRIEELEQEIKLAKTQEPEGAAELEKGSDEFEINYTFRGINTYNLINNEYTSSVLFTWDDIFFTLSPLMINEAGDYTLVPPLNSMIEVFSQDYFKGDKRFEGLRLAQFNINTDDYHTIIIQLRALGLIAQSDKARSVKDSGTYWKLTPYGDTVMTRLRAKKKQRNEGLSQKS